eukprot:4069671-Amphidinium_carterae.2
MSLHFGHLTKLSDLALMSAIVLHSSRQLVVSDTFQKELVKYSYLLWAGGKDNLIALACLQVSLDPRLLAISRSQ